MSSFRPLIFWTALSGVFITLFFLLSPVIGPFLLGWLLAYALNPLVRFFERWLPYRWIGIALTFILFFALLITLIQSTLPLLIREFWVLSQKMPLDLTQWIQNLWLPVHEWTQHSSLWNRLHLDQILQHSMNSLMQASSHIVHRIFSGGQTLITFLWFLFMTPLSTFYFLKDWSSVLNTLRYWIPRSSEHQICSYIEEVHQSLARFVRGQISVCLLSGLGHTLGLWSLGLEGSTLIGVLSGFLAFVPYGALSLGMTIALVVSFIQFGTWQAFFLVILVFLVVHLIEANILIPKLVGDQLGLHPLWVIFIFFASAELFGFWGLLLALPAAACLKVLFRIFLRAYLQSPYYQPLAALSSHSS